MEKKQIVIVILIGFVTILLTLGIMYAILNLKNNNSNSNSTRSNKNQIKVGNYTVNYGKYIGIEKEYAPDTDTVTEKNVYLELTNTMIKISNNIQTYTIIGNKLVTSNKLEYEVIGNNRIQLLVGGGITYEYQG